MQNWLLNIYILFSSFSLAFFFYPYQIKWLSTDSMCYWNKTYYTQSEQKRRNTGNFQLHKLTIILYSTPANDMRAILAIPLVFH